MVWLFGELLVLIDDSGNFVVLCILLGVVYYLVSVIDCVVLFQVVGIIVGDDIILVVVCELMIGV